MMRDELETLLRLVADGTLSPEDAAPIVAAIQAGRAATGSKDAPRTGQSGPPGSGAGRPASGGRPLSAGNLAGWERRMRIRVTEDGRDIVDVKVPLALAGLATDRVPGLSDVNRARIRKALDDGLVGPILEIRDGGDEVRIVVE